MQQQSVRIWVYATELPESVPALTGLLAIHASGYPVHQSPQALARGMEHVSV
jgi:hypothetical protein